MKILVTGAGALLGQGIIRSLRRSPLNPYIVGVDPSPYSAGLYWCESACLVPTATDPDYMGRMRQILERERPDAVLIGTDVELGVFAAWKDELETGYDTRILVSSPDVIAIAGDKYRTFEFFRDHGFPCPASCLPGEEDDLLQQVGFPLVVKPRIGARSVGVVVVEDKDQLDDAVRSTESPVIQECVGSPDVEYTAGALSLEGCETMSIVMRRDLRDGNTFRAYSGDFPDLNARVRRYAETLGAYGPANFQFRLDGDEVKVFEINARFSGTTPLRCLAGFNEVEMCLRRILLSEDVRQPEIEELTILRHWDEVVVRNDGLVSQ